MTAGVLEQTFIDGVVLQCMETRRPLAWTLGSCVLIGGCVQKANKLATLCVSHQTTAQTAAQSSATSTTIAKLVVVVLLVAFFLQQHSEHS